MPCTPEELDTLVDSMVSNKAGSLSIEDIKLEDVLPATSEAIENARKAGWFSFARVASAMFGDEFRINAVRPVQQADIAANNFVAKQITLFKEAIKPLKRNFINGVDNDTRREVKAALETLDESGNYAGRPGTFRPEVLQTAQNVHKILRDISKEHGLSVDDFIKNYYKTRQKVPKGVLREIEEARMEMPEFLAHSSPENVKLYRELERKGILLDWDDDFVGVFSAYIHGIANTKFRVPVFDEIEKNYVNQFFNLRPIKDSTGKTIMLPNDRIGWTHWKEYQHYVLGGTTPLDHQLTNAAQTITRKFGYDTDARALYRGSQVLSSGFYAGVLGSPLGGRPASIIRQLFQLIPTYAELGAKYTAQGINKVFEPGAVEALRARNMMSSHIDNLIREIEVGKSVGKVVNAVSENFLKLFASVDQFTRAATAYAAEARFNDYLARGIIDKLPSSSGKEIKERITKLIARGQLDRARDEYMFDTVGNLQYFYGKASKPRLMRGALGNLMGVLTSYPLNTMEMARLMAKQFDPKHPFSQESLPLLRLIAANVGLIYMGKEFLNADLTASTIFGAVPTTLAFPQLATDATQAGLAGAQWLRGQVFMLGETDYQRKERAIAMRQFARDLRSFVPGGLFFFEDIPKAIDRGTLTHMLALTPLPEQLDVYAKERAKAARAEQSTGGLAGIKPLQSR